MKAIMVQSAEPGHPLVWQETSDPVCGPEEALVDVYATSVNRADLAQRAGTYPPPPGASEILGLDASGRIAQLGSGVTGWQVGDRVCALLAGGGYAERVAVPFQMLMPIPGTWSFEEAAALPEVFLTAFVNLFVEAALQPGETVLVHGGGGGVGTAAIQLIRQTGSRAIVTAGTAAKLARCRELGADLAVNYKEEDFVQRTLDYTGGQGVDVILDIVGASYLPRNLSLLKPKGRLVFIATLGGNQAELNLALLMARRLRLIGSVLRGRSLVEKIQITKAFVDRFWPLLEAGTIRPVVDRAFPIRKADEAHQRMAQNLHIGKIVLKVREEHA